KLSDLLRLLHEEDAAHVLPAPLCNPAALPLRVVPLDELGNDARKQPLALLIPAVLLRVESGVALDHPAEVAGLRRAKDDGQILFTLRAQQFLNGMQRFDEAFLLGHGQFAEHPGNLPLRLCVQRREGFLPSLGEREKTSPPVVFGGSFSDQSTFLEGAQGAAHIACVQSQLLRQVARRGLVAVSELVEDAALSERIRAAQPLLVEHANLLRVEAIEAPHCRDPLVHASVSYP